MCAGTCWLARLVHAKPAAAGLPSHRPTGSPTWSHTTSGALQTVALTRAAFLGEPVLLDALRAYFGAALPAGEFVTSLRPWNLAHVPRGQRLPSRGRGRTLGQVDCTTLRA